MAHENERRMSVDEFRREMFQSLKDAGTIDLIRAQLRRRLIEKLQIHQKKKYRNLDAQEQEIEHSTVRTWHVEEKIVHGLLIDYLEHYGLEHTMAVFLPEIGGQKNQLPQDAILEMLPIHKYFESSISEEMTKKKEEEQSLIIKLVHGFLRQIERQITERSTQTNFDSSDHRLMLADIHRLENELRRVETQFIKTYESHMHAPVHSIEERMLRYQRECDAMAEERIQQEVERFKDIELKIMQAEERKRFERQLEELNERMAKEYLQTQQRVQDREAELETAYVRKQQEQESMQFETRQQLLREMEKLQAKEAQVRIQEEEKSRWIMQETKRLQLLDCNIKTREEKLELLIQQTLSEKEELWKLEKKQLLHDIHVREDQLASQVAAKQIEDEAKCAEWSIKWEKEHEALVRTERLLAESQAYAKELENRLQINESDVEAINSNIFQESRLSGKSESYSVAEQSELQRLKAMVSDRGSKIKSLKDQVESLKNQIISAKLEEGNLVILERKKHMDLMETERQNSIRRETEMLSHVRKLQRKLSETEATAEKYQIQYEDERIHVESLRHEVASLNCLLLQTSSAVNIQCRAALHSKSSRKNDPNNNLTSNPTVERALLELVQILSTQKQQMQASSTPVVLHSLEQTSSTPKMADNISSIPNTQKSNLETSYCKLKMRESSDDTKLEPKLSGSTILTQEETREEGSQHEIYDSDRDYQSTNAIEIQGRTKHEQHRPDDRFGEIGASNIYSNHKIMTIQEAKLHTPRHPLLYSQFVDEKASEGGIENVTSAQLDQRTTVVSQTEHKSEMNILPTNTFGQKIDEGQESEANRQIECSDHAPINLVSAKVEPDSHFNLTNLNVTHDSNEETKSMDEARLETVDKSSSAGKWVQGECLKGKIKVETSMVEPFQGSTITRVKENFDDQPKVKETAEISQEDDNDILRAVLSSLEFPATSDDTLNESPNGMLVQDPPDSSTILHGNEIETAKVDDWTSSVQEEAKNDVENAVNQLTEVRLDSSLHESGLVAEELESKVKMQGSRVNEQITQSERETSVIETEHLDLQRKQDEEVIDGYRQKALARRVAKQKQEQEHEETSQTSSATRIHHVEAAMPQDILVLTEHHPDDSEQEEELSGGSFAESSAASSSDSF